MTITERIDQTKREICRLGQIAQIAEAAGEPVSADLARQDECRLTAELRDLFDEQEMTEPLSLERDPIIGKYLVSGKGLGL